MKIFSNPDAKFKSKYGQYQIAILGNIVGVSAEGMADQGAIARYAQDMIEVIGSFKGTDWAFLGFLHGSALLTKAGEEELQRSVEWRAQHGMALGALVIGDTTVQSLVTSQFQRIYRNAGLELGVFVSEQEAMQWLADKGFES